MEVKVFLEELCGECGGCSEIPTSIERLCSNPLEKYLYRKGSDTEAYFRGRRDGLTMREANIEQAHKAGIKEVVEFVKSDGYLNEAEWQAKLKDWGISK